ncbi:MAG: hypothetical protein ABSG46_08345 [Candidatus Binataceae bacterium]|jgi:hypothetical protein
MAESRTKIETDLGAAKRDFRDSVAALAGAINGKVADAKERIYPPALVAGLGAALTAGYILGNRKNHFFDPVLALAAGYLGITVFKRARSRDPHEV